MSTAKTILGIVPGLQATSLLAMNLKNVNDNFKLKPKKKMNMKKPIKNIVKTGVGTMIGIGMIGPTASMINAMD